MKAPNLVMVSRVNREIIIPPPSGTAMQSVMRQILSQVVRGLALISLCLAFCLINFDFVLGLEVFKDFEDFLEVFDITNIPILVMLFLL